MPQFPNDAGDRMVSPDAPTTLPRRAPEKAAVLLLPEFPPLGLAQITVVRTPAEADAALRALMACEVVGFDTESKPTFVTGEVSDGPHVVQFASARAAWIFQLHLPHNREAVAGLLAAPGLVKAGFGLDNDRTQMRRKFGVAPESLQDLDHRFRQRGYGKSMGVKAGIALLFGQRFVKSKRTSTANWAKAQLTDREVEYAANDAYAAMRVFDALAEADAAQIWPADATHGRERQPAARPEDVGGAAATQGHADLHVHINFDTATATATATDARRGNDLPDAARSEPSPWPVRSHGGPDALGAALHDFSTNANACGPCPSALLAVQAADASRYPDPHYTDLRARLAAHHGVAPQRLLMAASGSEAIARLTAWTARRGGRRVAVPMPGYGDYAHAAHAWALDVVDAASGLHADLVWHAEPSSPLGQPAPSLAAAIAALRPPPPNRRRLLPAQVADCAYQPLRLDGTAPLPAAACDHLWQLWTPNKALGLTGIRAAYLIAPLAAGDAVAQLESLAPSWPVGAHGVAMLQAWCERDTQAWLADSILRLTAWKVRQLAICTDLGWQVQPSIGNFFCAWPLAADGDGGDDLGAGAQAARLARRLLALRAHGVQLRDAASFGMPGQVRLSVQRPVSQDALARAWRATDSTP